MSRKDHLFDEPFDREDILNSLSRDVEAIKQRVLIFAGRNTFTSYEMEDWFLPTIDKLRDLQRQIDCNRLEIKEDEEND